MFSTLRAAAMGDANTAPMPQTLAIPIFALNLEGLALNGCKTARCLSTAIAVNVNTDTFTDKTWTNGQNGHMKCGRFHL